MLVTHYTERRLWGMHKEISIGTKWISFGYSFKRFGIGFNIDKYHMDIDLVFFWFGVEW
jgi:hypothetical protein